MKRLFTSYLALVVFCSIFCLQPSSQAQDRNALVEFLEDALAQAEVAQTPRCNQEKLDQGLKQALLDYQKALTQKQ